MRNKYKLAGLLLLLLVVVVAVVASYRRNRADEASTSTPVNGTVSPPTATHTGSDADADGQAQAAAPSAQPSADGVAQGIDGEAPRPVDTSGRSAVRGGAQPKAAGASKAKVKDPEPPTSALAAAGPEGESSDRSDAGVTPAATVDAAPPAPEMGLLIGRIHNSVDSALRLIKVSYFVDGAPAAVQSYPKGLEREADVQVFERRMDVGDHVFRALVEYQGNGGGLFSYFDEYHYNVSSSHPFTVTPNATTQVTVVTYDKGSPITSFENRLAAAFRIVTASGR